MNNYKENAFSYIAKGLPVIPDRFGQKLPAIKQWTKYCQELPTKEEVAAWSAIGDTNIALCLGQTSGLIALDFDCVDQELIELIEPMLPDSPVERHGSKGWVRFFRYNGEHSFALKHNGNVVLEILSDNKKVTIPPSKHPHGMLYTWRDRSILDVNMAELPLLPPALIPHIESTLRMKFPTSYIKGNKIINGRNDALSSECGKLIEQGLDVNEIVNQLIKFDEENHETPLFTDLSSYSHTERFSNALAFYVSHLQTINGRRLKDEKEYEIPIIATAVNHEYKEEVLKKKEQKQENQKRESVILPEPVGTLKDIQSFILENSYVPQPSLALSAALIAMSVTLGRKFEFMGNPANLYLLNVSPSGSGKDAPQKGIKEMFSGPGLRRLLGAGDYVSDASLVDSLETQPVRLDLIDEASTLLKTATRGGESYNGKMAEILCQLYTSSNSIFLGRRMADDKMKGECERPFVSALLSTTPTGFAESINRSSIDKGLLGRVLVFKGTKFEKSRFNVSNSPPPQEILTALQYWTSYKVPSQRGVNPNVTVDYLKVPATDKGMVLLREVFNELDEERQREPDTSRLTPIIARKFMQLCKIALIHAASRLFNKEIVVDTQDIAFARALIEYNFQCFQEVLVGNVAESSFERDCNKILKYILERDGVTSRQLSNNFRHLKPRYREELLEHLRELGDIEVEGRNKKGKLVYIGVNGGLGRSED